MNSEQLARPTRLARWIDGLNAFGPIFSKELRVASRRKRNYVLRALYLTILTVIVVLSWYSVMDQYHYSKVNRVAQMSQVGISLLLVVAWFQFGALQLGRPCPHEFRDKRRDKPSDTGSTDDDSHQQPADRGRQAV